MSKREVIDCDKCGKESSQAHTFRINTGKSMDAAGGYSTDMEIVDLCPACCANELQQLLTGMAFADLAIWARNARKKKAVKEPAWTSA
jgi:hypothetical protein